MKKFSVVLLTAIVLLVGSSLAASVATGALEIDTPPANSGHPAGPALQGTAVPEPELSRMHEAGPVIRLAPEQNGRGAFGGQADYDSGWVYIDPGEDLFLTHDLGGDPDDYVVDMYVRPGGVIAENPVSQKGIGEAFAWYYLTADQIIVHRGWDDTWVEQVRLRIWVVPDEDFDSGWFDLDPGDLVEVFHQLGGNADDYVVHLQYRVEDLCWGLNNIFYGLSIYYTDGDVRSESGAAWQDLTTSSIKIYRGIDDIFANQVRVRIWRVPQADYDTGWQTIHRAQERCFEFGLGGPWNDYFVDVQFMQYDEYGRHQTYYGGNKYDILGTEVDIGASLRWLSNSYLCVHRGADDTLVDRVRARVWADPRPKYDSGWTPIARGESYYFTHNLGGDPDDYHVDVQFRDTDADGDGGYGVNHWGFGGDGWAYPDGSGDAAGAGWSADPDFDRVEVYRSPSDARADEVRVRIWIAPPADFDLHGIQVAPGEATQIEHHLGGDPDDYVVDLLSWGDAGEGNQWHAVGYGTDAVGPGQTYGFGWRDLTAETITIERAPDSLTGEFRVRIWRNPHPDYDSTWRGINPASTEVFGHWLYGDPDLYTMDVQFRDTEWHGVNHMHYGGDLELGVVDPEPEWWSTGAFWYNLNDETVSVWREADDGYVDATRARVWFTGDCFELDALVDPPGAGTVDTWPGLDCNDGTGYREGSTVRLTAEANDGYVFDHWGTGHTANPIWLYIVQHWQITAHFVEDSDCFDFDTEVNPPGAGSIGYDILPNCPGPGYLAGTEVRLTANPSEGYAFSHWSSDVTGSLNPLEVTVNQAMHIVANYVESQECYTLNQATVPPEGGTIFRGPLPNCNGGIQYQVGTVVRLTALPAEGYTFDHWSGDAAGTNAVFEITMDADKDVTAHFDGGQACFDIVAVLDPGAGGDIDLDPPANCGASYIEGTVVQVTARANEGWAFSHWGGDAAGTDNPLYVTVDADKWIHAHFTEEADCFALVPQVSPPGSGAIFPEWPPDCDGGYHAGAVLELTAVANPGQAFDHWSGDATGSDNPVEVTLDADKEVTAHFQEAAVGQILVDEAHDNQLSLDWGRAQEIEDEAPWTDDPGWFSLEDLQDALASEFLLVRNPESPLTVNYLQQYEAVIIPVYWQALTSSEVDAIQRYVAGGGGLVLLGDCGFDPPSPELSEGYDIEFDWRCLFAFPYDPAEGLNGELEITNFAYHPAVIGVAGYRQSWGQNFFLNDEIDWLTTTAGDSVWRDDDGDDEYDPGEGNVFDVAVARDTGCGRVAAVADSSFSNQALEYWPDNVDLMRALLRWTTGGQRCVPGGEIYLPLILRSTRS